MQTRKYVDKGDVRVVPLARGLAVLSAFSTAQPWMGNQEVAIETGIPAPTVSRMLHSLAVLGYLRYDETRRKYRLAASALTLGYAAVAGDPLQRAARIEMQKFADASATHVVLGTRDRLDVIVSESHAGRNVQPDLHLAAGIRVPMASTAMGWALLGALPERERFYLQSNVERRSGRDWPSLRRQMAEGMSQLQQFGFCMSMSGRELAAVAVPVSVPGHPSAVLACVGRGACMHRARLERELGPRLAATAHALEERLGVRH
ncbi:IclR family transcriptional regulator [Cupriavidus oxalaticus]|uniref:IclR family transcriptional regulator n=1 Tax=Cupriavidus oxalaticus TaxID=96344 RepID=UPI003175C377